MNSTHTAVGAIAVALTVTLAGCAANTNESNAAEAQSSSATPSSEAPGLVPSAEPVEPAASTSPVRYRDGEYSATGWYGSLPSHQDVTLTIQDDTVTAVEISTPAENDTSLGYQQRFADALPEAVVGRNIDELDVDRLAGSSGCSQGFMDAVEQIRAEASA